ncbi:ATP-binding cassette domain-containing protein [soil metagenome]
MIDVDIALSVADRTRRFTLAARFATDAAFAALYGPSGAGKSLTLQAMAGLLAPDRGHIRLDGRTVFDSTARIDVPARDRHVGYLFQDYALFPHLSVAENIAFGLKTWSRRRLSAAETEQVRSLLERFELSDMAGSRPSTLSGGQRQRVALARALACDPKVLLLDEPFAALNPMLRQALRADLAEVRRQWGIPALMITHDIDDVIELADVAFVYAEGQVIREVDLRSETSRDRAFQALTGSQPAARTDRRIKLRGMLTSPGSSR